MLSRHPLLGTVTGCVMASHSPGLSLPDVVSQIAHRVLGPLHADRVRQCWTITD